MAQHISTLLFDIGNVLVHWHPRNLYSKLGLADAHLQHLLDEVVTLAWHTEHDRGVSFADNRKALCARHPAEAGLIEAFDTRWDEMFAGTVLGMPELLAALKVRSVPLYALTNFSAEKYDSFEAENAYMAHFDGVVVSGREGLVKPDIAIFERTLERFALKPEAVLFIDDRADNVAAAEQLGMQGHIFQDASTLKARLSALGLL